MFCFVIFALLAAVAAQRIHILRQEIRPSHYEVPKQQKESFSN
jgi:hypothetical protein